MLPTWGRVGRKLPRQNCLTRIPAQGAAGVLLGGARAPRRQRTG